MAVEIQQIQEGLANWPNGNFDDPNADPNADMESVFFRLNELQGTFRTQVTRIAQIDHLISEMTPAYIGNSQSDSVSNSQSDTP
jgi:hypothetical protein